MYVTVFQTYTAGVVGLPASELESVCVVDTVIDSVLPGDTRGLLWSCASII